MPIITFESHDYDCHQGESVLECLSRHGMLIPSACQSGVCQTCITKAIKGKPTSESQKGLKDTLIVQNYFLPCVCQPEEDMTLVVASVLKDSVVATVVEKKLLNESVMRLRFQCEHEFDYVAGQFVNVQHLEKNLVRSYSLASLPSEKTLELHVKRVPSGQMSGFLHDEIQTADSLVFSSASGDCFYTEKDMEQPLLMVAVGVGLAPLYGIVRDALQRGHRGNIHLVHASLTAQGLYYVDELNALADCYENMNYGSCVLHGDAVAGGQKGDVQRMIQADFPKLGGWRVYICGDPVIVNGLQNVCFMAGASMADIYSDPFSFADNVGD